MIKEKDLKKINVENLKIFLINGSGSSEILSKFEEFLNDLKKKISLKIEVKQEKIPAYPAIKLTDKEEKIKIYYMAIPEGLEWNPFFNALKAISEGENSLNSEEVKKIKNIKNFIEIKVFITPFCHFCPFVVDKANQLAISQNFIKVFIIDATLYPDLAQKYKITASPTVVINENYILVGNEAKNNLFDFVKKAGEDIIYDKEVLKNLLKQGEAERLVKLCEKDERCLYSLAELLKAEELFIRIGVMRVFEELAERGNLIEKVFPSLIEMLNNTKNERDRGDILYLLGLIGTPEIISDIEKAAENASPTIKEIAYEAIEQIKQRKPIQ